LRLPLPPRQIHISSVFALRPVLDDAASPNLYASESKRRNLAEPILPVVRGLFSTVNGFRINGHADAEDINPVSARRAFVGQRPSRQVVDLCQRFIRSESNPFSTMFRLII